MAKGMDLGAGRGRRGSAARRDRAGRGASPRSLGGWLRSRRRGGLTKRFALFCASCGLLLGSATPPEESAAPPVPAPCAAPDQAACAAVDGARSDSRASVPSAAERQGIATPVAAAATAPLPPSAMATASKHAAATVARAEALRVQRVQREANAVRIVVSLPLQRAYVFRGRELVATSPVSTGRRGHATPTGRFRILQKRVSHFSNLYANAPMPYMQRLTHSGIALHGGRLPGYPASHGCIRLPHAFARRLYRMTDFSTVVSITHRRPRSSRDALRLI